MANVIDDGRTKVPNGVVLKSGDVTIPEVTDEDLKKINKFTLKALSKEDVFVFKISACDNGLDDRNFEPFNLSALKDLKKLYVGKTVIKDHARKADNQIARVFETELLEDPTKTTGAGEVFTTLQLKAYMLRTKSNEDLIAEIEAGIKREVSTGCRAKHAYCSICGTDNTKTYCPHYHGREYDTKDGKKTCYFTLDGAKEAYEVSLVAVPAQPRAGTTKSYKEEIAGDPEEKSEDQTGIEKTPDENPAKISEKALGLKERDLDAFIYAQKHKYLGEESPESMEE
ncbi:MAG: hypothetical protein PHC95_15145 [Parabacteroides sp.]|nr:hypothetical protein [Parabacteroides sp.]